jgi:hypothetical protein
MILSKRTLNILKNCSDINQSLLFRKGSKIKTISQLKNILFEADVDEVFPFDFGIYDLLTFLSVANNSMKDANINFEEDKLIFKKGIKEYKYYYCEPTLVVTPPEKSIEFPDECFSIYLMKDVFEYLMKGANIGKLADLVIVGCQESNSIYAEMTNLNNDTSNGVRVKIANKLEPDNWFLEVPERRVVFKRENLKIMPFDYEVKFANGISEFKAIGDSHKYWIALEASSIFTKEEFLKMEKEK